MNIKICTYAICKNEEKNVTRWVESVKESDQVVVLDTGSSDNTLSLLEKYSSDTFHVFHENFLFDSEHIDFAKMRNKSLSLARSFIDTKSTWIFVCTDFDEFLEPGAFAKIKEAWLQNPNLDAINISALFTDTNRTQINFRKVHSTDPHWKWIRRIHETLSRDDKKKVDYNMLTEPAIQYIHDQDLKKERNYYEILKRDLEDNPHDVMSLCYAQAEALRQQNTLSAVDYAKKCLDEYLSGRVDLDEEFYGWYIQNKFYSVFTLVNYEPALNKNYIDEQRYLSYFKSLEEDIEKGYFKDFRLFRIEYSRLYQQIGLLEEAIFQKFKALSIRAEDAYFGWIEDSDLYSQESESQILLDIGLLYNKINKPEKVYEILEILEKRSFQNSAVEELRNKTSRKLKEMNKVAIYAICKNELQFLDKWYKSMSEADCIVVLDTGSTDGMWEALQELSKRDPKVIVAQKTYTPWRFDTPRNDAMALVPSDYNILMSTDLDELLDPGWAKVLRESWVEGKHQRCTYKYIWSHLEDGVSPGRVFGYNKIHTRDWIWRYPVHELLWNTKTQSELYPEEVSLNLFDEITLQHYPDQTKSRANYLPLLELREKESKEDWYGLIYLAHEYYYQGFYQKAIDKLDYILTNYRDKYTSIEEASCYLFKGDSYRELGDTRNAISSYFQAISIEPVYREPYISIAKIYEDQSKFNLARSILKEALEVTRRQYTWLERDYSWSFEIYDLLAIASYYSGHKLESIAYAAIAQSLSPNDQRLLDNLRLCIEGTPEEERV